MKVLVCGSRYFYDWRLLEHTLYEEFKGIEPISEIIHGGAAGADCLAGQWAIYNEVPTRVFPANWDTYGKGAGPIRNKRMLEEGRPSVVVGFLAKNSRGTRNMIDQAEKAGVKTIVISI